MSIVNECMIVNLQIGVWQGYRLDKDASRKVTDDANAEADAARVNKHIVPKETLKKVNSASTAIRAHFYKFTLPWKDNGDRILTRKIYVDFMMEHAKLRDAFNAEVEEFLSTGYPRAKEQARFRMGTLFNGGDYPSETALRHKFYVNLDIDPVATANDFRVKLSDKQEAVIKTNIEAAMADRVNRAMADVWTRLASAVSNFADRMQGETYFKDATIKNVQEIVEILPKLNVLEDPQLAKLAKDVQGSLCGYTAAELRADDVVRSQVAGEAKRIMEDMAGFMNAFKQEAA